MVIQLNQVHSLAGTILRTLEFLALLTSSCCFGGPNYDDLYVTTIARHGSTEEELVQYPLTGSVFRVTGLGVRGSAAPEYGG